MSSEIAEGGVTMTEILNVIGAHEAVDPTTLPPGAWRAVQHLAHEAARADRAAENREMRGSSAHLQRSDAAAYRLAARMILHPKVQHVLNDVLSPNGGGHAIRRTSTR
jgi:hypothetical protein